MIRHRIGKAIVATATVVLVTTALTGAASPSHGGDRAPTVKVTHGKGWSSVGPTDVTITETTNPDGTSSADAGSEVAASATAGKVAAGTPKVGDPEVTHDDIVAYVNHVPAPGEVDEGPQPDSDGIVTYVKGPAQKGAQTGPQAVVADPMSSNNAGLPAYDCTGVQNFSDNDVHFKTCAIYTAKRTASGHTYFGVQGIGSAWSSDSNCINCDRITGFGAWNDLTNGVGYVYSWAPRGTSSIGSCGSKTVSTSGTAGGFTSSVSETEEVCPESFGFWGDKFTDSSSGSIWHKGGAHEVAKGDARGAHFVELADWRRSSTLYLAAHGTVWWH